MVWITVITITLSSIALIAGASFLSYRFGQKAAYAKQIRDTWLVIDFANTSPRDLDVDVYQAQQLEVSPVKARTGEYQVQTKRVDGFTILTGRPTWESKNVMSTDTGRPEVIVRHADKFTEYLGNNVLRSKQDELDSKENNEIRLESALSDARYNADEYIEDRIEDIEDISEAHTYNG